MCRKPVTWKGPTVVYLHVNQKSDDDDDDDDNDDDDDDKELSYISLKCNIENNDTSKQK